MRVLGVNSAFRYSVVIPTKGSDCLNRCLSALEAAPGPAPEVVVVVDNRPGRPDQALRPTTGMLPVRVVATGGVGPAAARNAGWRATSSCWVAFLDDDMVVRPDWRLNLVADLAALPDDVAGVQGRIEVPVPDWRKPTDAERAAMGLASAWWMTADMAYRRAALAESGGFDERFRRAVREDSDLALRLMSDGWELRQGNRITVHPVRAWSPWLSVRAQAGNADDALMRTLHGPGWQARAGDAPSRRLRHLAVAAAAAAGAGLSLAACRPVRRRRGRGIAAAAAWSLAAAGTAEFAAARIAAGPLLPGEVATTTMTSMVIPHLATWHWLRGRCRARRARGWPPPPKAILFVRDGTLIHGMPYTADPASIRPAPTALQAVSLARARGMRIGLITSQSGIGRGLLTTAETEALNARVAELLGPFDVVRVCSHPRGVECDCREPAPGMVLDAAAGLGLAPHECAVVGDLGTDVQASRAAGARSVLVPTGAMRQAELAGARHAADLLTAVRILAGEKRPPSIWPSCGATSSMA